MGMILLMKFVDNYHSCTTTTNEQAKEFEDTRKKEIRRCS